MVVDHEGVAWTYGRRELAALACVAVFVAAFLVGIVAYPVAPAVSPIAALVALVAVYVAVRAMGTHTARVTTRAITVTTRTALGGTSVTNVRLDDVVHASAAQSKHGDWALVVRTRDETTVIGSGEPKDEVVWMGSAVHQAIHGSSERERVEGREWGFLRNAPEAITALTDDPHRKQ